MLTVVSKILTDLSQKSTTDLTALALKYDHNHQPTHPADNSPSQDDEDGDGDDPTEAGQGVAERARRPRIEFSDPAQVMSDI